MYRAVFLQKADLTTLDYCWRVRSLVVVYGGVACEVVSSLVANYVDMTWAKDLRMLSTENGRYLVAFEIPLCMQMANFIGNRLQVMSLHCH